MSDRRTYLHSKPRVVRKLLDSYSGDEGAARPWVSNSTSDSDTSDSNHKSSPIPVPLSQSTHRGYCSDSSPCKNLPPIGVFWDIENCQIPRGKSAVAVAQRIRDKFFDGYREAEFLVVCDVTKETSQVVQELNDAQVNLIHVGAQCKNAADEKLRQSIRRFADIHGSLATIVLISGDINFAPDLCDLRHRKKIHVILVHNDNCSESLILCANEHYFFSALVASLPLRGSVKSVQPAEVTVSYLPVSSEPFKVKQRLKRLAENCGGRVGVVVGELATIRFPSLESATRAQKRMHGELVFGSQIVVSHPMVVQEPQLINKETSLQKGANLRRLKPRKEEETQWSSLVPPQAINSRNGFQNGGGFQSPRKVFANRENVPLPVPPDLWKSGCNFPILPVTDHNHPSTGRFILGRRDDINRQPHQRGVNASNQSGRHSLDSMLDGGDMNGDKRPSRPPSLDNWTSNGLQDPEKVLGVNFSMPPPPIVNLPRKENQYVFQPIPIKPMNQTIKPTNQMTETVELLVTNLDGNISSADLKIQLFAAFTHHCRVQNVTVFVGADGLLAAKVRVGTQQEAQRAKNALRGHKIGLCPLHISYAQDSHELTPSPASSSSDAGGGMSKLWFCGRHSQKCRAVSELPCVRASLPMLAARLNTLITAHDGKLPLASLMDCYAAQFEPFLIDQKGVPLEHLVTCVQGVELTKDGSKKYLRFSSSLPSKTETVDTEMKDKLTKLSQELVELLKMQTQCQILFKRLIPAYRQHFGTCCKVSDYGCSKLIDVLELLSDVVQVIGEGESRVVTLSHSAQVRRFTAHILRILRSQPNKQVSLRALSSLWESQIGRPLEVTEYGVCYIDDLLSALDPKLVKLPGEGDNRVLTIIRREQTDVEKERLKQFANEVVELLAKEPSFTMEFTKFINTYNNHFRKQCKVADYGLTKLVDLFEALPDIVKVEVEGEASRNVTLTVTQRLKVLSHQVLQLVLPRYPPGLPLDSVHSAYLWQYGSALKPSLYQCQSVAELLKKLDTIKMITREDGTKLLTPEDQGQMRILCLRTLRILWERGSIKTTVKEFEQIFSRYYKEACTRLMLETQLKDVVKVTDDSHVQLTTLQLFARDVYHLLCASDGRLALSVFNSVYKRTLDSTVSPVRYGYPTVLELLQAIDHVVIVAGKGPKRVVILNPQLADVGIPLPTNFKKSEYQNQRSNGSKENTTIVPTSQVLLKALTPKLNGSATEGTGLKLLSPAEFLQPACALAFHPSSPHPSTLPKPGDFFNLTQKINGVDQFVEDGDLADHNKRKFRLAAHFASAVPLNQ